MTAPDKNRSLADALRESLGSACLGVTVALGEAEMLVPRPRLFEAVQKLRDDPALAMNQLIDVCAVDEPAEAERFIVVYHLLSLKHNWRLRVVLRTDEATPVASLVSLYPSAGWFEREAFDLFGIVFEGHPDLRRLLTDYDFEGYPLRRDFPLTGFVQLRYDDLNRKVVQEPVALEQDFRPMDSQSPWRGMTDVQRRGG